MIYLFVYKLKYRNLEKPLGVVKDLKRFLFMRNLTIFIFFNRLLSRFGNEVNEMVIDAEECCGQPKQMNIKVFGVAISPAF